MSHIEAVAVASTATAHEETEEPPSSSRRHKIWQDVPLHLWEDWRWQRQNAIRTTSQLTELLPHAPGDVKTLESLESQYKLAIPPYYFSLIDVDDPADPIRLQSVPSTSEMTSQTGIELEDPLEEDKDSPVPGLTHRYPDRVLLVTTHVCTMYCRFCTRKRVTMDRDGWDAPSHNDERMINYVRQHPEIHDVIVSGGDPLSLPLAKLRWFVSELAAIDHVDVIRIGTRVPVTLPQRLFDSEIVDVLAAAGKIWIQTHFNHPREITPETARACRNLVNAGMPVSNHAVLLKGVNDSVATMRQLMRGLLRIKVRPYYLFHCDPVVGAGHFRTSVWKGLEIIEGLRGHISGLGVPTYVVDGLHGAGKIPLMPNYLVSASDNAVVLRNYEGLLFRYAPEDRDAPATGGYQSLGVSNLLAGQATPLIPEGNRRMARREARTTLPIVEVASVSVSTVAPAAEEPSCCGDVAADGNGHHAAPGNGRSKTNGRTSTATNGRAKTNGTAKTNGHAKVVGQGTSNGNGHTSGNGSAGAKTAAKASKPKVETGRSVSRVKTSTSGHRSNGHRKSPVHAVVGSEPPMMVLHSPAQD